MCNNIRGLLDVAKHSVLGKSSLLESVSMSKGGAKGAQFPPSAPAFVIGAGPLGCTFARKLVARGKSVLLIDSGSQLSPRPGENHKNAYIYQRERDMNRFTNVIAGHLVRFSTPVDKDTIPGRDPAVYIQPPP